MVCSILGTLGEIIKAIAGGLSGIIDQALEFLGLSGNISGVNMSAMNSLVPASSFSYGGDRIVSPSYTFNVNDSKDIHPLLRTTTTQINDWG
jgi:hypothetical protein